MLMLFKPWRISNDIKSPEDTWLESFIKFEHSLDEDSDVSKIINNINYLNKAQTNVKEDIIKKKTTSNVINKELVVEFSAFENEDSIETMDYMRSIDISNWKEHGLDFIEESNKIFDTCVKHLDKNNIPNVTDNLNENYCVNVDLKIVNDHL